MMGSMSYTKKGRVTALMHVNGYDVHFQLDSGADVNIICAKFVKKNQILFYLFIYCLTGPINSLSRSYQDRNKISNDIILQLLSVL